MLFLGSIILLLVLLCSVCFVIFMICFTLRFVRNLYFFMVSKHSRIKLIFTLFYILQTLKTQKYILHFLIIRSMNNISICFTCQVLFKSLSRPRSMKILVYVLLISNVTWKENLSQKKFQKVPLKNLKKLYGDVFVLLF